MTDELAMTTSYRPFRLEDFSATAQRVLTTYNVTLDSDNSFIEEFQSHSWLLDCVLPTYTLGELADSLSNEAANQWDIDPKRVSTFLTDKETGLLQTMKLYQDIEVGYTQAEVDALGNDAPFVVVSGRHRLLGILTMYSVNNYTEDNYRSVKVRCIPRVYISEQDRTRAVFTANGSRSMTSGEKRSVVAQAHAVDVRDLDSLVGAVAAKTLRPSIGVGLAFVELSEERPAPVGRPITRQTYNLIGTSYVNNITKLSSDYKKVLRNHSELLEVITEGWDMLPQAVREYDEHTNLARVASSVGAKLAELVLNSPQKEKGVEVVELKHGGSGSSDDEVNATAKKRGRPRKVNA
jgi:hypothetical protein